MKNTIIITDSHCGISIEEAEKSGVKILPMPLYIDEECVYEGISVTRKEFFERLKNCNKVSTSQASVAEVTDLLDEALEEYENILYMPISSGLSSACNTAKMIANEEKYINKVFVVDNGRISTPMHRSILDAIELLEKGFSAQEIKNILEKEKDKMSIYIAVETLEYLKKGGRISATTAAVGTLLDIKPILKLNTGLLEQHAKCRGFKKAKKLMLEEIKNDIENKFGDYTDDEIYLLAATSADEETTARWIEEIKAYFPGKEVLCDPLSLGICCHTGEGALGIGISCKPKTK
ncbi:MAG: DegV family protein [Clostridia bacterium]|nr:DegV family protein [Clostridia bacterium]